MYTNAQAFKRTITVFFGFGGRLLVGLCRPLGGGGVIKRGWKGGVGSGRQQFLIILVGSNPG